MNSNGSQMHASSSCSSMKGRSDEIVGNNSCNRSTRESYDSHDQPMATTEQLRFAITANTTANIDIDRGNQFAEALRRNGCYAQAIEILDQTQVLRVAIFIHGTRFHMDIATIIFNMGMLAHGWGRLGTAQALYEEAIGIARALCPESNANFIRDGLELLSEVVLRRGLPVELEVDDDDDTESDDDDDETFNEPMARTNVNYRYMESIAFARLVAVCRIRVEIDETSCAAAA